MKRILTTVLVTFALMGTSVAHAENVTVDQAKSAAATYMRQNTTLTRLSADQLTLARQWDNPALGAPSMYLFVAPEQGWIIMSACTAYDPVVAYADDNVIRPNDLAPQLEWWLDGYNSSICDIQNLDAEKPQGDRPEWDMLMAGESAGSHATKANTILMKTKWNQGDERGLDYNMLSPVVNDSVCPTGCVATALAQICKYYAYPVKTTGNQFYNWYYTEGGVNKMKQLGLRYSDSAALDYSIMPNSIAITPNGGSNITRERRYEVSRLGYYLGIAVQMQFSPDGSGSNNTYVLDGMRRFFKYNRGTLLTRSGVSDTHFINTISRDVHQNRPVYMTGSSSTGSDGHAAGHAWVCDGYSGSNETHYHMNWGWGGSGDGFFNITILTNNSMSTGVYNFIRGQQIVTGLVPPRDSTDRDIYVGVRPVEESATLGEAYPNPATISVNLPYSCERVSELMVYSVDGRLVATRTVQPGNGDVALDVTSMPAGIYIYRMGNAHGKFVVR